MINVYFFPRLGADERLFSKISPGSDFNIVHIQYPVPEEGATMADYAKELSKQINTEEKFILIGVSIGGMICGELADFLKPEKVIIISSAKTRHELPMRYKVPHAILLHRLLPEKVLRWGALILQPIVEPDRNKHKDTFISMIKSRSPLYYKRATNMILKWERENYNENIIHIHGTEDHTIPFVNVNAHYKIEKGSHVMTLTRGEELNEIIKEILEGRG